MAPLVAVLAAGLGTRFGGGKLDAPCAGRPVGRWVLDAVAGVGLAPGVLVVGPIPPAFAVATGGWTLLTNSDPAAGLGGSVALAAGAALDAGRDLLLLLGDMPLVDPAFIAALAASGSATATRYPEGHAGVPALLPLAHLPLALHLAGARGAAPLLARIDGLALRDPPAAMLRDVDRPEDLPALAALLEAGLARSESPIPPRSS